MDALEKLNQDIEKAESHYLSLVNKDYIPERHNRLHYRALAEAEFTLNVLKADKEALLGRVD